MTSSRLSACLLLALVAAIGLRATVSAQQGQAQGQAQAPAQGGGRGGQGGGQGQPPPPPDPVPTSAASIILNPKTYLGRPVTITASVARQVAPTAFTVGQNKSTAQGEVLVITAVLTSVPAINSYVTVIGDAFAFDPAELTKRMAAAAPTLPADVVAAFLGKPAIIATAIVASDMSDLTKRKPAPMTPDDEKLSAIMKQVSPAATALRTAATANDADAKAAKTAELKKLFTDAQGVFKARGIMTATLYAGDAMKALDAGDITALTATCTTCHNAHRARQDDGTYRLKTEAK